jgi:hypothetical protein
MKLWLSRDQFDGADYQLWRGKPTFNVNGYYWYLPASVSTHEFCPKPFEHITRIKLKPGECREIESIKIKLKPLQRKPRQKHARNPKLRG